jgi:hypothetical protein
MKKLFTGIICVAAILATSVILLPATAIMIAKRLSKPQDHSKKHSPHAEGEPSNGFLTEQHEIEGRLR